MIEYSEKLWIERIRKGYSRRQLGVMIGRSPDCIRDWETGRFAPRSFRDYIRWCRALDLDPIKTIEGDESL